MSTTELHGEMAQAQARKWGYDGDISKVDHTRQPSHIGCKWVYENDGVGRCVACGDWDSTAFLEDDDQ